jgi:serine/threonine protein phosphatase PrpC
MPLELDAGHASLQGRRKTNEDQCLVVTPATGRYADYGTLAAIADGVGGSPDGEGAARTAVTTLRESFYNAPETWSVTHALAESFIAANHAVVTGGAAGRASTLSCLVLRKRRWHVGHAGDSRVWLLRGGDLHALTRDHVRPHADIGSIITRGCGLDETIRADADAGDLSVGDRFVLTSDGVHGALDADAIAAILGRDAPAQEIAETLAQAALDAGSTDNATACVLIVRALPPETETDLRETLTALPVVAPPAPGAEVDGFRIESVLHTGRLSTLLLAHDLKDNTRVVLKFPSPREADNPAFVALFLREEWLGRRLDSPYLVKTLALPAGRRTCLYSVLAYHSGETLAARIRRRSGLSVRAAIFYTRALLAALEHLHRMGVIHRDVKPENILIDETNQLRLMDLGVSRIERLEGAAAESAVPIGTPTYMAPEIFLGQPATARSDLYSAGVTLYEMLTTHFPYGEIEAFSHPRFSRFTPPERYNPEVPVWLSEVLRRACAVDPDQRYADTAEFNAALANPRPAAAKNRPLPLLDRVPPGRWKLLFMLSLVANVIALIVYLVSG